MGEHLTIIDDDFWTAQRFRYNRTATTDPTVNDDATLSAAGGYAVGSLWFNTSTVKVWVCEDATIGAAVWSRIDVTDHGELAGLTDDDHTQYLKEKASGGTAAETPTHDHSAAAEAGSALAPVTVTMATAIWSSGTGTPEGAVTAPVGSVFTDTAGGAGTTLYVKESGTGNTGWRAV